MVDTVLYFEGDRSSLHPAAAKNRFGATDGIGVFEMASDGLREVANPSSCSGRPPGVGAGIGSVRGHGSRARPGRDQGAGGASDRHAAPRVMAGMPTACHAVLGGWRAVA